MPETTTKIFVIYFRDLKSRVQKELLTLLRTTEKEENWDIFPIAEVERAFPLEDDNL